MRETADLPSNIYHETFKASSTVFAVAGLPRRWGCPCKLLKCWKFRFECREASNGSTGARSWGVSLADCENLETLGSHDPCALVVFLSRQHSLVLSIVGLIHDA